MSTARSLRLRLLVVAGFWIVLALLLTGIVVSELLRAQFQRLLEGRLDAEILALMAATEFDEAGVLELVREPPEPAFTRSGSGWYWQLEDRAAVLLTSRSLIDGRLPASPAMPAPGVTSRTIQGPDGRMLLIRSRQFSAPGDPRPLVVHVAAPLELLAADVDRIRRPLMLSLLALGAGLLVAVGLQVSYGLQPLARLRRELAAVRSGEAERISSAPVSELEPLTDEINALIVHAEGTLHHARTHVGNLAHGLKTPLAALLNGIRASHDPDVRALEPELLRIQQLVELHLRRARHAGQSTPFSAGTPVLATTDELVTLMARVHPGRDLVVEIDIPEEMRFAGDSGDLQELLGNLLDNAWKWAATKVRITGRVTPDGIAVSVEDDGSGMADEALEQATRRGLRLDEAVAGHGLGLAIVTDLCQLHGGALMLTRSSLGGLCATLQLPRRHRPPAGHQ